MNRPPQRVTELTFTRKLLVALFASVFIYSADRLFNLTQSIHVLSASSVDGVVFEKSMALIVLLVFGGTLIFFLTLGWLILFSFCIWLKTENATRVAYGASLGCVVALGLHWAFWTALFKANIIPGVVTLMLTGLTTSTGGAFIGVEIGDHGRWGMRRPPKV